MANSKTYLQVPFAQKEAAKALGAKWDPANKKWYIPANTNITPFAKWYTTNAHTPPTTPKKTKAHTASQKTKFGTTTYAQSSHFIAYNGDEPPWN